MKISPKYAFEVPGRGWKRLKPVSEFRTAVESLKVGEAVDLVRTDEVALADRFSSNCTSRANNVGKPLGRRFRCDTIAPDTVRLCRIS